MNNHIGWKILPLIIFTVVFTVIAGCKSTSTATQSIHNNKEPIEVISVFEPVKTPNPGGNIVEITLKNTSDEPIVSLNVTFDENIQHFNFDFGVTSSNPLSPNKQISAKQRVIGFGDGIQYSLAIDGTLQSGHTFSFTWIPSK